MIGVLNPVFVEFIPETLEDGKLYVSQTYATAVHKCCCGCGLKVVTPLSPTGWRLTVNGGLVTLYPSIGNWSFPCRSHYWIRRNEVDWSYAISQREIDFGRSHDADLKRRYYASRHTAPAAEAQNTKPVEHVTKGESFWGALKRWLFG